MALRKITIIVEEEQYQRLRRESFEKHTPISELIRMRLEEKKEPSTPHTHFGVDESVDPMIVIPDAPNPFPEEQFETAIDAQFPEGSEDAREVGICQAPNTNCKNEGYLYQVTFMTDEGERKKQVFLCGFHLKKTRDAGNEVVEV